MNEGVMLQPQHEQYKVEILEGHLPESTVLHERLAAKLSKHFTEGWKLHSIIPQIKDGSTVSNHLIFERIRKD